MKKYKTVVGQFVLLIIIDLIGGAIYSGFTPSRQFLLKREPQLQNSFTLSCRDITSLPLPFQKGYVLAYQREVPGIITLVDVNGNVVWSYRSENAGFKMVSFTRNHTLLCITGTKDNDIGYGNAIVELSLRGDTLLYLKKGQNDFKEFIHHEIFLNKKDQMVTLTREERIVDLSKAGGSKNDTVVGDGVLVLNKNGQQVWKWTVFDALNPLNEKEILKLKKDWMHANSISLDRDGNYLVSFYNNGQVWKINSITGEVIWKFGKGGDFEIPYNTIFHQAHAAHINNKGWLMLFDNGADKKRSRSLAFAVDTVSKRAEPVIESWVPPSLYSDRMGSTYLVGDTALLVCLSRHKTIGLTNLAGDFLWKLSNKNMMSYRAEFIPGEMLTPYLNKY